MAILLKRKRKATSVAIIVWSPRNGEKAMKTPIEKASAVRSGGSSIASRRRKAARNIWFQVSNRGFEQCGFPNPKPNSKSETVLLKTLQGFCFILKSIEDRKQLCNNQEVLDFFRQIQEF